MSQTKWASRNPAKVQGYHRKCRYGLTEDQYQAMLIDQDNKCAICKELKPLVVDHCHSSEKVRGLLCRPCNIGLGYFEQIHNIDGRLSAIKEYLENE